MPSPFLSRLAARAAAFAPHLAGESLRDRAIACLGVLAGVGATGALCAWIEGSAAGFLIVAPIGASSVLLFAVPASPMAQPWPVIGGNTVSALIAFAVAGAIGDPVIAAGPAVALAIAAMSLLRCLHPPGGAIALSVVLGGPAIASAGFKYAFAPVGLNSLVIVALGWLFHRFSRHSYPHRAEVVIPDDHGTSDAPAAMRHGVKSADIEAALARRHDTFDIGPADLDAIVKEAELSAFARRHEDMTCADVMSRDVIKVLRDSDPSQARDLLLDHNLRALPVVDSEGYIAGFVGLRQLARPCRRVCDVMVEAVTASPQTLIARIVPRLTDGRANAIAIVDDEGRIVGIVTQTDVLAALAASALTASP